MGRWKWRVLAAIWMAASIVPGGIAHASTTGLIAFTSDRDHPFMGADLYTMAADGTDVARLTTDATSSDSYSSPDWSYDGTKIALIKNSQVWVMNADGSDPVQLTTETGATADFHPSWSPDGTQIAYEHRSGGSSQIYVMNANGTDPHALTSSAPYDSTTPSWSPDGAEIAFASDRVSPFISQIYVMAADGSNQVPLTSSTAPAGDTDPVWSPDGTKIAFVGNVVTDDTQTPHIFVMNANGTNPVQITNGGGSGEGSPTWSPDGTQIAFDASYPPMPDTFAPSQIYKVNSDGGSVTDLSNNSFQDGSPAWQKNGVVDISAGQPVPEPATGSAPATFTITLPEVQASNVTVHYKTLDGTATAAFNDYTAIADGSVTIPAGQTSAPIQVQVDTGSGQATTATESFQVQLTSASGSLPISSTSATGVILIPGVSGTVLDTMGNPTPGVTVELTSDSGAPAANRAAATDANGRYQLYADPGTYTVTTTTDEDEETGTSAKYVPIACPGTAQIDACARFQLDSGANLTIGFKQFDVLVNSTALDKDPQSSLDQGVCDTTPGANQQTCTLPAAIQLVDSLKATAIAFGIKAGAGNTFDGAVPVIKLQAGSSLDSIATGFTIDGTTQPNAGKVEITGTGDSGLNLTAGSDGSVIRGLVINGFLDSIAVTDAGSVVIQGNLIGTDPTGQVAMPADAKNSHPGILLINSPKDQIGGPAPADRNVISGNDGAGLEASGAGGIVVQGNTIGPALGGKRLLLPGTANTDNQQQDAIMLVDEPDAGASTLDTIGGAASGDGNAIAGRVVIDHGDSVFQGNTVADGVVDSEGDHNTIGGPTGTPGAAPGNDFSDGGGLTIGGEGTVVQGNHVQGAAGSTLISLDDASHVTIGGDGPELGNRIEDALAGRGQQDPFSIAGIRIGSGPDHGTSSDNVVENNTFVNNEGGGAVEVLAGVGNQIFANRMSANNIGIDLGGTAFRFNTVGASQNTFGPNHLQPYPELLGATASGNSDVKIGLAAPPGRYTIDVYTQRSCARDEMTPGQGEEPLGRGSITVGGGQAIAQLSFKHASGAVTATATSSDGSTSEFSPCLTFGHHVLTFIQSGVTVPYGTVEAESVTGTHARDLSVAGAASGKKRSTAFTTTIQLFCPPVTTGFCAGTMVLHHGSGKAFATIRFKLAPGQLGALRFRLSTALVKLLKRAHRVSLVGVIKARDGARHAHHKSRTVRLTLALK